MSFIETIEIKNFKSIRHQKIEGCRKINVFIGYPNVGKSNIIEAISLLTYLRKEEQSPLSYFCRFKEFIDLFNDGDREKDTEIFTNDYVASLRYVNKVSLEFGIVARENYVENFNESTSTLLRFMRFKKDDSVGQGFVEKTNANEYTEKINIKKYHFTSGIDSKRLRTTPKVLSCPFGLNLAEVIRYNSNLRNECGELFSWYNLKLNFDKDGNIEILKQLDEFSTFEISFSQIADTLQRLIFYKAAIATNENSILLFEEPEAHMFPPYIRKFTTDIIYDKTNQFFIATHSPYVLEEFIEEAKNDLSIYVVDYDKGETVIKRLTDDEVSEISQYGIDLFFNLESYLDKHGQPRSA
jgi:AAA15 family ATPase/GTPase